MSSITLVFITVFFDMDGTLVRFIDGGDIFKSKYFEELPPQENVCHAADWIDGKVVFVEKNDRRYAFVLRTAALSSYLTNTPHDVLQEKNASLDMHTSIPKENRYFLPCGSSKWDKAVELGLGHRSLLIDDFGHNLSDWKGPYIKVSRDSEDMKKEMLKYKYCISPDLSESQIAETILGCIKASTGYFL